ncbi:hypothetical protein AXK35_21725 [Escherichia coli]|nr:hypothetical protein AXK35_21725 [Escherichia coli]
MPAVVQVYRFQIPPQIVFATDGPSTEDTGSGSPLWNEAKMLRPEADALFIRDESSNQLRWVIP